MTLIHPATRKTWRMLSEVFPLPSPRLTKPRDRLSRHASGLSTARATSLNRAFPLRRVTPASEQLASAESPATGGRSGIRRGSRVNLFPEPAVGQRPLAARRKPQRAIKRRRGWVTVSVDLSLAGNDDAALTGEGHHRRHVPVQGSLDRLELRRILFQPVQRNGFLTGGQMIGNC